MSNTHIHERYTVYVGLLLLLTDIPKAANWKPFLDFLDHRSIGSDCKTGLFLCLTWHSSFGSVYFRCVCCANCCSFFLISFPLLGMLRLNAETPQNNFKGPRVRYRTQMTMIYDFHFISSTNIQCLNFSNSVYSLRLHTCLDDSFSSDTVPLKQNLLI